ncbi:MAG: DUF1214 domain-containing protein, partial [Caldilineaceae bacterium]
MKTESFAAYRSMQEAFEKTLAAVESLTAGLSDLERERATFALVCAHSLAQEMWIFKADPAHPAFTDWMAHGRKTAGDSPYTVYLSTPVSAQHTYRVWGNLGQSTYFGMQLYRQVQGFNAPSEKLSSFQADAEGNFEVILSSERPANAANWLPLSPDDYVLMTREYRYDPALQRPMTVNIERLDTTPVAPIPLADRVRKAASYFESIVLSTIEIA